MEYALLVVLIAMVCIAAVQLFGTSARDNITRSGNSIQAGG